MTNQKKSVTIIGDSFSKGIVYDKNDHIYKVLNENYSNLIKDELNLDVNNFSICGIDSNNIKIYSKQILKKLTDDVVILELGFDLFNLENNSNLNVNKFKRKLIKIIKCLNKANKTVIIVSIPLIEENKYYQFLKEKNCSFSFNDVKRQNEAVINYNNEFKNLCRKYKLDYVDLNISNDLLNSNFYSNDGRCFSKSGHYFVKELVSNLLRKPSI